MKSWNMETISDISYVNALYKWFRHKASKGDREVANNDAEKNMLENLKELQSKYNCNRPE